MFCPNIFQFLITPLDDSISWINQWKTKRKCSTRPVMCQISEIQWHTESMTAVWWQVYTCASWAVIVSALLPPTQVHLFFNAKNILDSPQNRLTVCGFFFACLYVCAPGENKDGAPVCWILLPEQEAAWQAGEREGAGAAGVRTGAANKGELSTLRLFSFTCLTVSPFPSSCFILPSWLCMV